jgi:SAM-dependent methyltransferase
MKRAEAKSKMTTKGFWNRCKAQWYAKGVKGSTLGANAVPIIVERSRGARNYLDIGSGCGTLAIPLAEAGKRVTALDASEAMIELLDKEIERKKLSGIKCLNQKWDAQKVNPHDAVIISNVPALVREQSGFLEEVAALARKYVFIIESAGPDADKFYYKELYPLLFGKKFPPRPDYLSTYSKLHAMGIYANVEMIEYDFDQPFDDLDEAVEFWKEYLGIVTAELDEPLRGFLEERLIKRRGSLVAPFRKRSAIIWWRQPRTARTTKSAKKKT